MAHAAKIGLAANDDRQKDRVLCKFVVGAAEEAVNLAAEGRQLGVEWLIVEQDEVDGPPFDAVQRSFDAVRRFLPVTA